MDVFLKKSHFKSGQNITISGSKSETNRLLMLQKMFGDLNLWNVSDSDDSTILAQLLKEKSIELNVHHAGTAMRFLTAYYAILEGVTVHLSGSARMKERPIGELVDSLRSLGAQIEYLEKEGYPPLRIQGQALKGGEVTLDANVSSQYITALMLIAPKLEQGLKIHLKGQITSRPYIDMTLKIEQQLGIAATFEKTEIHVPFTEKLGSTKYVIESDWSSASYFYAAVALAPIGSRLTLSNFSEDSLQGDRVLAPLFQELGVETYFKTNQILELVKEREVQKGFQAHLIQAPDIAQTLVVCCAGLGIACSLSGLHTLKIKETDRLKALYTELTKLGVQVILTDSTIAIKPNQGLSSSVVIETYQDHRMAMSFAPLALRVPIVIKQGTVVSKSYKEFWSHFEAIGIGKGQ